MRTALDQRYILVCPGTHVVKAVSVHASLSTSSQLPINTSFCWTVSSHRSSLRQRPSNWRQYEIMRNRRSRTFLVFQISHNDFRFMSQIFHSCWEPVGRKCHLRRISARSNNQCNLSCDIVPGVDLPIIQSVNQPLWTQIWIYICRSIHLWPLVGWLVFI